MLQHGSGAKPDASDLRTTGLAWPGRNHLRPTQSQSTNSNRALVSFHVILAHKSLNSALRTVWVVQVKPGKADSWVDCPYFMPTLSKAWKPPKSIKTGTVALAAARRMLEMAVSYLDSS